MRYAVLGFLFVLAVATFTVPALAVDGVGSAAPSPVLVAEVSQAEAAVGAQNFINGMAKTAIGFLGDQSLTEQKRQQEFRGLLRKAYDMKTIGRFALGSYWRQATPKQQAEYQSLFEKMVVAIYSRRFGEYNGQQLEVGDAKLQDNGDVVVKSKIVPNGSGESIDVDWRVRNKGGYKIVDVLVEGVSMALTQRSDFASVIQSGGGDVEALLQHMRSQNF